jgi:hypothetical protein
MENTHCFSPSDIGSESEHTFLTQVWTQNQNVFDSDSAKKKSISATNLEYRTWFVSFFWRDNIRHSPWNIWINMLGSSNFPCRLALALVLLYTFATLASGFVGTNHALLQTRLDSQQTIGSRLSLFCAGRPALHVLKVLRAYKVNQKGPPRTGLLGTFCESAAGIPRTIKLYLSQEAQQPAKSVTLNGQNALDGLLQRSDAVGLCDVNSPDVLVVDFECLQAGSFYHLETTKSLKSRVERSGKLANKRKQVP